MKLLTNIFLTLSTLLISCGENTTNGAIADIKSIEINSTNISIYSTDSAISLTAYANYDDGSTINITNDVVWSSSNDVVDISSAGLLSVAGNGGDSNITIDYQQFNDKINIKVAKLVSINYSDINLSDTSNSQTIYVSGNFDNNDTNVTLNDNLFWQTDSNATISESNASSITLTLHNTPMILTGTIFFGTVYDNNFTKTYF